MNTETPYLDAVSASFPSVLSDLLVTFDIYSRDKLDTLVRYCLGGSCPARIKGHSEAWQAGQARLRTRFEGLEPQTLGKRPRDGGAIDDKVNGAESPNKKQKITTTDSESAADAEANQLYTLHSLSVSSPVRKKLDITITTNAVRLMNPSSGALEGRVELASVTRAFLISNTGKNRNKPHWTVVLMAADTWDKKDTASQVQLTFGVDHTPANAKDLFTTTAYPAAPISHAKGTETLSYLQSFLSHLPNRVRLITAPGPDSGVLPFKSSSGQPYVEAYRNAKEGALYFLEVGILWAESKPCEFFALEDLARDSDEPGAGGVKTLSATGRTLSLFIRRRGRPVDRDSDFGEDEEEVEMEGEETEFAMIDGRESENIMQWVRKYKRLFGNPVSAQKPASKAQQTPNGKGKAKAEGPVDGNDDDSDTSDEEFAAPSESDGGEPSSDSEDNEGDGNDEGSDGEAEAEGSDDERGVSEGAESQEELDPAQHPLLRPGAMPRMSKAAMEAAVSMIMGDLAGDEEEDEEDELE